MEIIPILAFIVLVATASTFMFAFGAYIMFKIRESKGKVAAAQKPPGFQAEYVTPDSLEMETVPEKRQKISEDHEQEQPENVEQKVSREEPRYLRYTSKGYLPVKGSTKNL